MWALMNPEHRFRFNNPNWRDYRSGKTSAPPCLHLTTPALHHHLHHHHCPRPLPPPHSQLTFWPFLHITHGSSVRRKGDLTANLAQEGPWSWGLSTSRRIPVFSWLPPSPFPLRSSVPTEQQRENISPHFWGWLLGLESMSVRSPLMRNRDANSFNARSHRHMANDPW